MDKKTEVLEKLKKGRERYQEKLRLGIVTREVQLTPKKRWLKNKKSLRLSINAFCYECIGEKKEEIKNCTAKGCPLYEVRPYRDKISDVDVKEDVKEDVKGDE